MPDSLPDENLANYLLLLSRVDQFCGKIIEKFAEEITCRAGCSGCCRHLALFPVEAANLFRAVKLLPDEIRLILAGRSQWPEQGSCPLLLDDRCTVYCDRPVICRTHGMPLLAEVDGVKTVDCCPENFRGAESLPGSAVINLETLNSALAAINVVFAANNRDERFQGRDRFSIADIIILATDQEPL
jgi:hypothetical protein